MGKRTIMGMGCLIKECPQCDGVGHIEAKKSDDKIEVKRDKQSRGKDRKGGRDE
jgi:hypothetical protein